MTPRDDTAIGLGLDRADAGSGAAARFLRAARLCRIRDLERLLSVSELLKDLGELIHALQKERGASSVYLGSNGAAFADRLATRVQDCCRLEQTVRDRLETMHVPHELLSSGAQFYNRLAIALFALDGLPGLRAQVSGLTLAPLDAVKAFTDIIRDLLAVIFEAADVTPDPLISRALAALFNVIQGKEFAGQERATAGMAFARGHFSDTDRRRLRHLIALQERAFHLFGEFAEIDQAMACRSLLTAPGTETVERMRHLALTEVRGGDLPPETAEIWVTATTQRIDALKGLEDRLTADLRSLCGARLADARADLDKADAGGPEAVVPVAMVVMDSDLMADGGETLPGIYALDGINPRMMRSILDVVQSQSRQIKDVSSQLETARVALAERKTIDRAKGVLMGSRGLTEEGAYKLMRKAAMNQNKRIFDVAEAIMSTADILRGLGPESSGG